MGVSAKSKPYSDEEIAGIVLGTMVGTLVAVGIAFACYLLYCKKKIVNIKKGKINQFLISRT